MEQASGKGSAKHCSSIHIFYYPNFQFYKFNLNSSKFVVPDYFILLCLFYDMIEPVWIFKVLLWLYIIENMY